MNSQHFRPGPLSLAGALVLLVFAIGATDFVSDLGTDYGVYFSHGWFMTKGLAPYLDFWTHKTPFLTMIIAAWIAVAGTSVIAAVVFPLLLTSVASVVVYRFSKVLELSSPTAAGAAALFAFFAGSHVIDPTRNGVIIIAATTLEMLALMQLIRGLNSGGRRHLALAGVLMALAIGTRQTSAVVGLPALVAVLAFRGLRPSGRVAIELLTLAVFSLVGLAGFVLYFNARGVPLGVVWDQVYSFNLVYSAGYRTKLTWWVSEWMQFVWARGLVVLVATAAWSAVSALSQARTRRHVVPAHLIILAMAAGHAIATYASHKVTGMYLLQFLPELSILAAMAIAHVAGSPATDRFASLARVVGALGLVALVLAGPIVVEVAHWRTAIGRAAAGGYLTDPSMLPMQVVARQIQTLVPAADDRIWVFSASADALYPFANRLPSMSITSTARLTYVLSPDDFAQWQRAFAARPPSLVVSFYGNRYVEHATRDRRTVNGRRDDTMLQIRQFIVSTMRRVDDNGALPEFYVR